MTQKDIAARVDRLTKLSAGFGREIITWRNAHCHPSLYRETQGYLAAIRDAQNAVEQARITLLKLNQRLAKLPRHQ
jgi:hypothetical protein